MSYTSNPYSSRHVCGYPSCRNPIRDDVMERYFKSDAYINRNPLAWLGVCCSDCVLQEEEIERLNGGDRGTTDFEYSEQFEVGKYIAFIQQRKEHYPFQFYKQYLEIEIIKRTPKQIVYSFRDVTYGQDFHQVERKKIKKIPHFNNVEYVDFPTGFGFKYEKRLCATDLTRIQVPSIIQKKKEKKAKQVIKDWFLEVRYNPAYRYCRKRINKMYDDDFGSE